MTNFERMYDNERTRYVNDANHFDGRNGYHQHTGNTYRNGNVVSTYSSANDRYTSTRSAVPYWN